MIKKIAFITSVFVFIFGVRLISCYSETRTLDEIRHFLSDSNIESFVFSVPSPISSKRNQYQVSEKDQIDVLLNTLLISENAEVTRKSFLRRGSGYLIADSGQHLYITFECDEESNMVYLRLSLKENWGGVILQLIDADGYWNSLVDNGRVLLDSQGYTNP